MGHEVGAALARAGVDDKLASDVIERSQHRHLVGLSRRWDAQVGAGLRPGAGEIRMRQRLAFVAVETRRCSPASDWRLRSTGASRSDPPRSRSAVPSACVGAVASGSFFSQCLGQLRAADAHALANFDFGAQTGNRPVPPVGHRLVEQRRDDCSAVFSLLIGGSPGAMLAFNAATPPLPGITAPQPDRVLPHAERLKRSAPLVQPERVGRTAHATGPPPRGRAVTQKPSGPPARCSSLAAAPEICHPCRTHPDQCRHQIATTAPLMRLTGSCLAIKESDFPSVRVESAGKGAQRNH